MNFKSMSVAALAVGLCASSVGFSADAQPTMPGKPGDVWTFTYSASFKTTDKVSTSLKGRVKREILDSNQKNRVVIRDTSFVDSAMAGSGMIKDLQVSPAQPVIVCYHRDATVDHILDQDASAEGYRLIHLETIALPAAPLAAGLTWTYDAPASTIHHTPESVSRYQITGSGEHNGVLCWQVEFTANEVGVQNPASMSGTAWLRQSDLLPVELQDVGAFLPVPGSPKLVQRTFDEVLTGEASAPVVAPPPVQGVKP